MPEDANEVGSSTCGKPARDEEAAGLLLSEALFGGRREIAILHRGARYTLRITRQGKLILNKSGGEHERDAQR